MLAGTLTHSDSAGAVRHAFSGRMRGHKLPPGRYQLTLTPAAGGKRGRTITLAFRIAG